MVDESNPEFGEAVSLIRSKYNDALTQVFRKMQLQEVLCFFEFWGPNSFAGRHQRETHDVTLIDISIHKKGILLPRDFIRLCDGNSINRPRLVHYGFASEILEQVKSGTLEGVTFEGVVGKVNEY